MLNIRRFSIRFRTVTELQCITSLLLKRVLAQKQVPDRDLLCRRDVYGIHVINHLGIVFVRE